MPLLTGLVTFDFIDGSKSEAEEMDLYSMRTYEIIRKRMMNPHSTREAIGCTITKQRSLESLARDVPGMED